MLGEPDFVGNLDFIFDRNDWTFFWGVDFIGKSSEAERRRDGNAAGTQRYKANAEFTAYHNTSVRYASDNWAITAGVSNVFDDGVPFATQGSIVGGYSNLGNAIAASQYDYVGRRGFIRLSRSW